MGKWFLFIIVIIIIINLKEREKEIVHLVVHCKVSTWLLKTKILGPSFTSFIDLLAKRRIETCSPLGHQHHTA